MRHTIDPGLVNHQLVETILGEPGIREINRQIDLLPDLPDWMRKTRIGRIYTRVTLAFCEAQAVASLGEIIGQGHGRMFCSTEQFAPCASLRRQKRVRVSVVLEGDRDIAVELAFGTEHISSDTLRAALQQGERLSAIAAMPQLSGSRLTFQPLVIGTPWLESDDPTWSDRAEWFSCDFYEHFVEDFVEFSKVRDVPLPTQKEAEIMAIISETAVKTCLAEILGDETGKDWGGERSDHFSAHLTLGGRRTPAAFLLKGPARFAPMGLNHLGKNNDQIVRLAQEPAEILFVQHCHDILSPVRDTLRAFAVQPSRPRRYCLVDGRDTLRLLIAYDKLDRAKALSHAANS